MCVRSAPGSTGTTLTTSPVVHKEPLYDPPSPRALHLSYRILQSFRTVAPRQQQQTLPLSNNENVDFIILNNKFKETIEELSQLKYAYYNLLDDTDLKDALDLIIDLQEETQELEDSDIVGAIVEVEVFHHFVSRLQSVEECPIDAHLEHVKFPRQAVCLYPGTAHLDPYTENTLLPGVPPPITEFNKGGSVPLNWQKPGMALTGVHPGYSATASGRGLNGLSSRGSRVVWVSDRGWLCHEFEPSTTKDPPCRAVMHDKSVES
ncbi:hypothetical protein TNCV_5062531 [Trichonephila clavipes]|nr:hypothetical protein TNCV_5062531 [Trichonephila clavipes]